MGSKSRIRQKLKQSAEFAAVTGELDRLGFSYTVHAPTGSGHPFLMVSIPGRAESLKVSVACTPHQKVPQAANIADLRRRLRSAGVDV